MNEHIVYNTQRGLLLCEHCERSYAPTLPIPLPLFTALLDAFVKLHTDCSPPKPHDRSHEITPDQQADPGRPAPA